VPPRYVYWTIIVDGQPTAFRSGSLEDIMPTFNRLKEKQPSAELKWFQNGQLWPSRHDAQDFMRARGERGRAKDPRQSDPDNPKPERAWNAKPEWKTRSSFRPKPYTPKADDRDPGSGARPVWVPKDKSTFRPDPGPRTPDSDPADKPTWTGQAKSDRKPEWKPKGTFKPKEAGHASGWGEKPSFAKATEGKPAWRGKPKGDFGGMPAWKPKDKSTFRPQPGGRTTDSGKPEWKPKGTFRPSEEGHRPSARDQARSSFRPKPYTPKPDDRDPGSGARASRTGERPVWVPKDKNTSRPTPGSRLPDPGSRTPDPGKRKWVPKAEYKKSLGIEAKRDDKWRPGGEHKDPKQKYKDAKKAKWSKFKANIRARSAGPKKRGDD